MRRSDPADVARVPHCEASDETSDWNTKAALSGTNRAARIGSAGPARDGRMEIFVR